MKIRSVSHVGVTVSDFERAVNWYNKYFGFRLISEQVLEKKQVAALFPLYQVKDSSVKLGFLRAPKGHVVEIFEFSDKGGSGSRPWNQTGPSHFTLDVRNVPGWYEQYREELNFVTKPQVTDGNHWVFMRDPDGNLIELIDLKKNYWIIRWLGGIAGEVMKQTKFKNYYRG